VVQTVWNIATTIVSPDELAVFFPRFMQKRKRIPALARLFQSLG